MNYRLSEFCHFIDGDNDLVALYNSLTLGVVIVDKCTAQAIRNMPAGIISSSIIDSITQHNEGGELIVQLLKQKMMFQIDQRTDTEDYLEIQKGLTCKKIGILYLLTTDACNLACSYCFIENAIPAKHRYSMMTEQTAEAGIDLFSRSLKESHGVEEPQIIFYGGEPMSNIGVIKHSLVYIREKKNAGELPENTSITINTNGTLVSQEIIEALSGVENLTVAISVDGPKELHDSTRFYHSGKVQRSLFRSCAPSLLSASLAKRRRGPARESPAARS